jgi:hypothetical protein
MNHKIILIVISLIFVSCCSKEAPQESLWEQSISGKKIQENNPYFAPLDHWPNAFHRQNGAIVTNEKIQEIKTKIDKMKFPIKKDDFWRIISVRNYTLKVGGHTLTTGNIWEEYYLSPGTHIHCRTTFDPKKTIHEFYDSACISKHDPSHFYRIPNSDIF